MQNGSRLHGVGNTSPRGAVDQRASGAALREQGLDFPAKVGILRTGVGQEATSPFRLLLQGRMVKLFDLAPPFEVHG